MNWIKGAEKNKEQHEVSAFERHGFVKLKDSNKKVYVSVNECEYQFDYETNKIYEISDKNIKFAVCVSEGKQMLFTNQDYIFCCKYLGFFAVA